MENPDRRQGPGLNLCLHEVETRYAARLDGHTRWNETYLETLVEELEANKQLAAAGGLVRLAKPAPRFEELAWQAMTHPFGTGGPAYRNSKRRRKVSTLQSPVYRLEALREVNFFREDLPWAEDDELHHRLQEKNWELILNPAAKLSYRPRSEWRSFTHQFYNYGRGRGKLAGEGIFPTLRHWRLDKLLALWTFLLCWNPVGWGLGLVHLFISASIGLQQAFTRLSNLGLIFLFPLMHGAYWLGWLRERFKG